MSDSMIVAFHVTLDEQVNGNEVQAIAETVALFRPVCEVKPPEADVQAQIATIHAKRRVQRYWASSYELNVRTAVIGTGATLLAILDVPYYDDAVEMLLKAISRIAGVTAVKKVYWADDYTERVQREVERIKDSIVALLT
ncbi:hypothetical protein [Burkholderia cepacia]|uniref:hypothetical protein n=1 Tax=Burkholderia cepacia TaxID=292 RepID=UPI002AB64844|nr:hypothetical protein [Burkholderia cepacia]